MAQKYEIIILFSILALGLGGINYPLKAHVTGVAQAFFQSHNLKTVTMKTKEVFKDIPGYEGLYQVSNLGNIKSLGRLRKHWCGEKLVKEKMLSNNISKDYYVVKLYKNSVHENFLVHQLVTMAFLNYTPNGFKGLVIDHIDNDKLNNNIDNLQLITQRENCSKDRSGYSSKYVGVSWAKERKKWRSQIFIDGKQKYLGTFINEIDAYKAYQKELKSYGTKI